MPSLEQLYGPMLHGPINAPVAGNRFAGRATIGSGGTSVVVSTSLVGSDSLLFVSAQSDIRQASGFGQAVEVATISPGISFTLTQSTGVAVARPTTVLWMIVKGSD